MMLTDKELQTLRNQGNDDAADEIESLRAKLEVLSQQKPVAWFEKSPEFDAWFVAYSCNPKAETRPLYLAPGAQSDPNLSCKSVQKRLAAQWGYVRGDAQAAPVWQNCPTHGRADARAWGCPECVREMRDEIQRLRAAVQANHEWHELTDDYGGYPESEICEINTAALALTTKTEGNP